MPTTSARPSPCRPSLWGIFVRNSGGGGVFDSAVRRDEVLHRVATMHVAADRAGRIADLVGQQIASFEKIADAVKARVGEGRELPIESRAAELRLLQARQRFQALQAETDQARAGFRAHDPNKWEEMDCEQEIVRGVGPAGGPSRCP